jgi:hypothetical protein
MERFLEHTKKVQDACSSSQSPDPIQRKKPKRVDTGLKRNGSVVESPCRVSISPSRPKQLKTDGFSVKPAEVNHFTGKKLQADQNEIKLEVDR